MRKLIVLLVSMIVMLLACSDIYAQSPQEEYEQDQNQLSSVVWSFDPADLNINDDEDVTVLSVSPSGQYIAAACVTPMNPEKRMAAEVSNPYGRLPDTIYLFLKEGEHYRLDKTIPIDTEAQLELSSILGGGSAFAWNEEETKVIITSDWGSNSSTINYIRNTHSNLYLLEIESGTFRRLTQNDQQCTHAVLVKWMGNDMIYYIAQGLSNDSLWYNTLCAIELKEGTENKIADLYSAEGSICPLFSWEISEQCVYYTVDAIYAQTGFFKSPIGGKEEDACCLIDLFADLRQTNRHPYCNRMELCAQGISSDGKWACLSLSDPRILNRDIPLADDPGNPQNDPANAVSVINGQPWIPCHNILLYNLETEQLENPFTDESLHPDKVIVTGACFAPDGNALLCAVFGDGGPWTTSDYYRTTFYQISLIDGNFTAVRVFETDAIESTGSFDGLRWLKSNILCIQTRIPPLNPVIMIKPAVWAQEQH